ncbi:hypothetical protein [uncultured Enterovirga sp.]|uniref:hypothetical protein n=1 Tax=uncultured Enterovirga sp. TaxID=2026352 RepID=UPI0035CAB9C6
MKFGEKEIRLSQEWRDKLSGSKERRICMLPVLVDRFNVLSYSFPDPYSWRFKTAASFLDEQAELVARGTTARELNDLYWRDTLSVIEAYSVSSVWRMVDICQAAFRAVEQENIVPAGILARSAFESAVQFVQDARTISATLEGISKADMHNSIVVCEDLEKYLLRTMYASRLTGSDEIYKSTSILTTIGKISKASQDDQLQHRYEVLCELTHPNFLGRSIYLTHFEKGPRDGDEVRFISHLNGKNAGAINGGVALSIVMGDRGSSSICSSGAGYRHRHVQSLAVLIQ